MQLLFLALAIATGFTVETVAGFGATVISASLAAHVAPVRDLLPVLVPLNLILSIYISVRYFRSIDKQLLFRRILPFVGVGLPFGMFIFNSARGSSLKIGLGALVTLIAMAELFRMLKKVKSQRAPLSFAKSAAVLFTSGVVHGALGTGGPLVVYWASRAIADKTRFRATLAALWLILGFVLLLNYAIGGHLTATSLSRSAVLLFAVAFGIGLGEWIHHRVSEARFRLLAYGLLLFTGVSLLLSN